MKKYVYISSSFFIVTLALAILLGSPASTIAKSTKASSDSTTANADSGRLVIRRTPNIGTTAVVNVLIDGKKAGSIGQGQTYNVPISAGPHVVAATLTSSNIEKPPTQKNINVQKGQTYTFTASWKRGSLSLD